ncbi:MAG: Gfo/Idh/MocA family oxidoreductase, partial [Leptolyngbyaceae bacterium]|nr:Gfo/Idh/MocA family oxidoreductase [Leptolyngbyaceae bacterium]
EHIELLSGIHQALKQALPEVGTGYAAKLRAETIQADPRSRLIAVAGHTLEKTTAFSLTYEAEPLDSWRALVERPDLDLVIVANINRDHGAIARAALQAGKHVVVEYPLSLEVAEAESLIDLATTQGKLLHVEHIELLSGIHQALKQALPEVGTAFYARYATITPQHPAPERWTYHTEQFGFPLIAALSRIHRLTDIFGPVASVSCQNQVWPTVATSSSPYYKACICSAQLRFKTNLIADVVYGKGETFWQASRILEIQGDRGALIFDGDQGILIQGEQTLPIDTGSRRGLFAKDTGMILDHLLNQAPLYVRPQASLEALKVADAARRSAETGQTILMPA